MDWILWVVAACILGIGEMHTGGLYLLPFAVGAGLAAVVSVLGVGLPLVVLVFVLASALAFGGLRPIARRSAIARWCSSGSPTTRASAA
jgi:membrane protein implicated in regulation of membrane protease activity